MNKPVLLLYAAFTLAVALVSALGIDHGQRGSGVFQLSNLVGPAAKSLLAGHGLEVFTSDMTSARNPVDFHVARMPVAPATVALGALLFGNRALPVTVFKTILFLIPIWLTFLIALRESNLGGRRVIGFVAVLFLPFLLRPFLADVVNLQVEEGYAYSLLALSTAIVLFLAPRIRADSVRYRFWIVVFLISTGCLYLTKSSMLLCCGFLSLSFFLQIRPVSRGAKLCGLALIAPALWLTYVFGTTGHVSVGTTLDGMNFHKGNNANFLSRYPPPSGTSLDQFDSELSGDRTFNDEYEFDSFHRKEALAFIKSEPLATAEGVMRKAQAFFVSTQNIGSGSIRGPMARYETASIVVMRLLFWLAAMISIYSVWTRKRIGRRCATVFLGMSFCCAAPYLAGFAYTRHASILVYPSALICALALAKALGPDNAAGEEALVAAS